ncbi:protein BCL9 homolog [Phlebotomus argentipes]|uniref:protein BCL9 homolog n=1 Tax=Phlebotomus argentipes TaxID=94469 RepID=UPI002892E699|nr:protein BCL9 homolog [Phlebotomus argentipes]
MLKEKREKGAPAGTPSSSPHATPPATPPVEGPVKREDADPDASVSPKRESASPRPAQAADKKGDAKTDAAESAAEAAKAGQMPIKTEGQADVEPPFSSAIQPLVSNMMGKQSGGLEYMQQSSQIFVFSTALANQGAESVIKGHFPSIIAYHCAQPGTKKILEKHPLKLGQFNRHTPWSLMGFGQKQRSKGAMMDAPEDGEPGEWADAKGEDDMPNGPNLVQGVKVPDENLTPQQRQHREEQLAMLRRMQSVLFPEQSDNDEAQGGLDEEKMRAMGCLPDFLPCPTQQPAMAAPGGAYAKGGAEWTRLQHHYCEERKAGRVAPQRAHGPPPPYHQTPRSASVPIATHSPSPNSPQNLTSTLSLPSPRGAALASPSDNRHVPMRHLSAGQSPVSAGSPATRPLAQSSPATPQSAHLSPAFKDVDLPPPDDKMPPASPARTPSHGDTPLKAEPQHAPSPGVTCSPASVPAHEKVGFFADISPEAAAQEHVNMGGNFALPDDNLPLNPDTSTAPETTKVMPFDPISSLAQMSQQLTNSAPPFNGAPGPNGSIMAAQISTCSYGPEMPQMRESDEMLECAQMHGMMPSDMGMHNPPYGKILPPTAGKPLSPKMVAGGVHGPGAFGGQMARMGTPAGRLCPPASMADSYNGASVQVRASAPNTIQYLPARPQMCPQMPRPPPSLDFLQRFANPMPHNGGEMMQDIRSVRAQGHMMNGVFGGQMHEGLFQGMRAPFQPPDKMMEPPTSQPYVGPSTTDPNYAQQFHNFQQQLYATTRSTTQGAPAQTYFMNK